MITIRKLRSLPTLTRHRKTARLVESWIHSGSFPSDAYLSALMTDIAKDRSLPDDARGAAREVLESRSGAAPNDAETNDPTPNHAAAHNVLVRRLDVLRGHLLTFLGLEPAEWDLDYHARHHGPAGGDAGTALGGLALYLESIRSPFNVGSILRTAQAFGVPVVGASADCPPFDHRRVVRSAMGAASSIRLLRGDLDAVRAETGTRTVVALETGGAPIHSATLPASAILVVGSEELGVSPGLLEEADLRITIPLPGAKASLNVGVAAGIALGTWSARLSGD